MTRDLLVFEIGGARLGLPLAEVREVLPALALAPLPGAPELVEGVADVRGEAVAVLDVRARFGLGARAMAASDHIVVAAARDGKRSRPVGLRVDRAVDVARVDEADVARASEIAAAGRRIAGVARLPDGLVLIADLGAFVAAEEASEIERALAAARGPA